MATSGRPASVIRAQGRRDLARPRDPNALVASAAIMTGDRRSNAKMDVRDWQNLAWNYYDEVGELRFGVNWLANALSRVNLVAAIPPDVQGDEPVAIDPEKDTGLLRQVDLVSQIAGGVAGQGQLLANISKQLTVPGVGYVLAQADEDVLADTFETWRVLSNDEVKKAQGGGPSGVGIQVTDQESGEWVDLNDDDLLIKVWRSHPRRSHEPDSPVRAVLSTLNEIKLLSMRVAADARSRLAGAGLLIMPTEAEFPAGQPGMDTGEDAVAVPADSDDFIKTFLQVAQISISDQESPAAKVPLVVTMPGEFIDKVQHMTFWSEFDGQTEALRQAAVKRLALGLDMPPEILLGMGDSNHWSAWQIAEEAITMQIEPLAELICHALTVGFLRPALEDAGLDPDSAIVWYDTTDLTSRPDLTEAASEAHDRIKISDAAYLREMGLNEDDAPDPEEFKRRVLLDVAKGAPTLAPAMLAAAGILPQAVADAAAAAPTDDGGAPPAPADDEGADNGRPLPDEDEADGPDAQAASAALLAAADGLVVRALERAGSRLRANAGKNKPGGAASIQCDDLCTLHCEMSATQYASLDYLVAGAWDRVPAIAERFGFGAESLHDALDGYTRALLAAGHPHDYGLLAAALGVQYDDARRLVATG